MLVNKKEMFLIKIRIKIEKVHQWVERVTDKIIRILIIRETKHQEEVNKRILKWKNLPLKKEEIVIKKLERIWSQNHQHLQVI
jgi:hypothetical protein